MGYPQGLGQDTKIKWKAASDQDEDDRPSSALRRPHASKVANPGLPVRPRSAYPPSDLPSTARSDSIPVYERAASDVSTLLGDTNPFNHIQSSMGRLSLQNSGGISWKMPLRGVRESTAGENFEADDRSSESESDGHTGSGSPPETHPPISIRSHVAAQLKKPDQDRNGMRIRRSHGFGAPETSSAKDLHTIRMENSEYHLPTIAKEIEGNGSIPEHRNLTSYIRQRKQRPVFGGPEKISGYGPYLSQNFRPTIKNFHPGQEAQVFPSLPQNHHQKEALDSNDGGYATPRPALKYYASTGDRGMLPGVAEAKYKDPYAYTKGVSLSKFKPAGPSTSGKHFDKNLVTTSGNGHTPQGNARASTYTDPYRAEQRPMGWIGRFNPDFNRATAPGEIRMPAVPLKVSPPPPYAPYMGTIPIPTPPRPRMMERKPPLEGVATVHGLPTITGVQETALPRASNRSHNNSSGAIDGTTGISFTISKDSSADECVRQARLLADMGERSQGPVPVADMGERSQVPMPVADMGERSQVPMPVADMGERSQVPMPVADMGERSQVPMPVADMGERSQVPVPVADPNQHQPFNMDMPEFGLDFANPLATNDELNDFDFDSFLHDK